MSLLLNQLQTEPHQPPQPSSPKRIYSSVAPPSSKAVNPYLCSRAGQNIPVEYRKPFLYSTGNFIFDRAVLKNGFFSDPFDFCGNYPSMYSVCLPICKTDKGNGKHLMARSYAIIRLPSRHRKRQNSLRSHQGVSFCKQSCSKGLQKIKLRSISSASLSS